MYADLKIPFTMLRIDKAFMRTETENSGWPVRSSRTISDVIYLSFEKTNDLSSASLFCDES